jgi:hypothetical protein
LKTLRLNSRLACGKRALTALVEGDIILIRHFCRIFYFCSFIERRLLLRIEIRLFLQRLFFPAAFSREVVVAAIQPILGSARSHFLVKPAIMIRRKGEYWASHWPLMIGAISEAINLAVVYPPNRCEFIIYRHGRCSCVFQYFLSGISL